MIRSYLGNNYHKNERGLLKMKKEIKNRGLESCPLPETTKTGYQAVWNTGRASVKKKRGKVTGFNRPSV